MTKISKDALLTVGKPEGQYAVLTYALNVALGNATGLSPGTPGLLDDADIDAAVLHAKVALEMTHAKAAGILRSVTDSLVSLRRGELAIAKAASDDSKDEVLASLIALRQKFAAQEG